MKRKKKINHVLLEIYKYKKEDCQLIHFMIDYENTRNKGLQGAEYLQADDAVTIFYSQACMKIEWERLRQIKESGCNFRICKLQRTRKNGLDFYIASRIGEIYGQNYTGMVEIVSNDVGFQAVRDYWKSCSSKPRNIILRPDIERCIHSSGGCSVRRRKIGIEKNELNLEEEYKKYAEQRKIRHALEESFTYTDYEDLIEQIVEIMDESKPLKRLYLDSVKQFGKKNGLCICHKVKQIV